MEESIPTHSELLHHFLDGELDPAMEPSLFSALNSSNELRAEMRELIVLGKAVRSDKAAFIPPIASTAAIFGTLGMSTSMLVSSGWLSTLWSKLWIPLAAAVVGSTVTWYALQPSATLDDAASTALQSAATSVDGNGSTPGSASPSEVVYLHDTVTRTRVVTRVVYSNTTPNSTDGSSPTLNSPSHAAQDGNSVATISELSNQDQRHHEQLPQTSVADIVSEDAGVATTLAPLVIRRVSPSSLAQRSDVVNVSRSLLQMARPSEAFRQRGFATLRGLSGSSTVSVDVAEDNSGVINNAAIGFNYLFNPYIGVVAEVGRESFAMKFRGVVDGTLRSYEANPSLLWGAVYAQVYPFPSWSAENWQPYIQVGVGGTNYGLLTKGLLGTYYSPTSFLRLMLGFEYSTLFYQVQNASYTTPKLGFTYGIGFTF